MNYVAECEQCGTIERGDLETVGDAADDHETFHEVRISRVVTDGGRPHTDTEYYVLDEDRTAVIEGPFQSKRRASAEAEACGPNHIVATETALELIELTSDRTLRWENEDIDLLTDGGYVPERGSETDSGIPVLGSAECDWTCGGCGRPHTGWPEFVVEEYSVPYCSRACYAQREHYLRGELHYCDICSTELQTMAGLATHACNVSPPLRADGGDTSPIRLGSVVIDKAENKPLRVAKLSHETAGQHDYIDVDDSENQQWGVTATDRVYECVYLTTYGPDESTRPPKRTYAFPEGRLYRYHCEAGLSEQSHRIHTQILIEFLAEVLAKAEDGGDVPVDEKAIARALDEYTAEPADDLLEEAKELADASRFGRGGQ
jgi:hypothetical protein